MSRVCIIRDVLAWQGPGKVPGVLTCPCVYFFFLQHPGMPGPRSQEGWRTPIQVVGWEGRPPGTVQMHTDQAHFFVEGAYIVTAQYIYGPCSSGLHLCHTPSACRYRLTAQPQVWAQPHSLVHSQATGRPHVQAGLVHRTVLVLNELGEAVPKLELGEAVPILGIH